MSDEKYTVRCMDGTALNNQTPAMSREACERLIKMINEKQTCTLPHTIHRIKKET